MVTPGLLIFYDSKTPFAVRWSRHTLMSCFLTFALESLQIYIKRTDILLNKMSKTSDLTEANIGHLEKTCFPWQRSSLNQRILSTCFLDRLAKNVRSVILSQWCGKRECSTPKVLICRKPGKNLWKSWKNPGKLRHRCFETFVLIVGWMRLTVEIRLNLTFFQRKTH